MVAVQWSPRRTFPGRKPGEVIEHYEMRRRRTQRRRARRDKKRAVKHG